MNARGSTFDELLEEEGIKEEVDLVVENRILRQENEKLKDFVKDCANSSIEPKFKYRAQVILKERKMT